MELIPWSQRGLRTAQRSSAAPGSRDPSCLDHVARFGVADASSRPLRNRACGSTRPRTGRPTPGRTDRQRPGEDAAAPVTEAIRRPPSRIRRRTQIIQFSVASSGRSWSLVAEHIGGTDYHTGREICSLTRRLEAAIVARTQRRLGLGASKPIRYKPVEADVLFGGFADKAPVNLCRDAYHELA
jgi:hypothetical protein